VVDRLYKIDFFSDDSDNQGDGPASNKGIGKDIVIEGIVYQFCLNLTSPILHSEVDHKTMVSYNCDDFMLQGTHEQCQ